MTEAYAESIARSALKRLDGVEKVLPKEDQLVITINPSGEHVVSAITASVSGAQTAFVFASKDGHFTECGKVVLNEGVT